MQNHICRVHVCLAVTCHLHFWQNDSDLLRTTAVTWGWNKYWRAQKVDPGGDNFTTAPAGTRTCDLITSPALYHWAIPAPSCGISWGSILMGAVILNASGREACLEQFACSLHVSTHSLQPLKLTYVTVYLQDFFIFFTSQLPVLEMTTLHCLTFSNK